jgi:hypothetical protein
MELRIRTAVGNGKEPCVDISDNELDDAEVKALVRLLTEREKAARERLRLARKAQQAADKARAEEALPEFKAFEPDILPDLDEIAYREACNVHWPDDPYLPPVEVNTADEATGPPPSYRYTPRSQRTDQGSTGGPTRVGRHASGRAKVLFRTAMQRCSMKQKALVAAAAVAAVEYEEGGEGCRQLLLHSNCIGSLGASHVGSLIRASEVLETVVLGRNPLGDAGAALLGRALQNTRVLRILALQDCGIGHSGIRHLCNGLQNNRSLTELWLYGNRAEDKGAAHLAGALRSCKLESLGLEHNGVRTFGCEARTATARSHPRTAVTRCPPSRAPRDGPFVLLRRPLVLLPWPRRRSASLSLSKAARCVGCGCIRTPWATTASCISPRRCIRTPPSPSSSCATWGSASVVRAR